MSRPSYKTCKEVSERCPVEFTTYGYYPELAPNAFFAAYFGLALLVALAIGIRTKTWTYTIAVGVGTLGEFCGYVGRILMHDNPWNSPAFQMQICCLVLAPSFVVASVYLDMKHIVLYCGARYSRLKPRLYPWIFVGCDFGSICLQAIGGGTAAAASNSQSKKVLDAGNALIVTGIAFQVATMAVAGCLMLDYFVRYRKMRKTQTDTLGEKPQREIESTDPKKSRDFKAFCASVAFAYVTILIRCIYRLPEMAGGWGNALMRKELEFLLLDGMMIALAVFVLLAVHPGIFFTPMRFASKKKASTEISESE